MSPVLVVLCRLRRRKPTYNGLAALYRSGMVESRLRSAATGGSGLDPDSCTLCDITGDHAPHEAGQFSGESSFGYVRFLVVFENHPVILTSKVVLAVLKTI